MKIPLLFFFLLAILPFSVAQNDADQFDASVPNHYFDFSLKLVKETPGFSPPVAARAFGYMGLTLYESVVAGIPLHTSTKGIMHELDVVTEPDPGAEYHWPTVANNALALITDSLFRTATLVNKDSLAAIRQYYNDLFAGQLSSQIYEDSKSFGEAIGHDMLNYSRTDGGHNGYAGNFPPDYVPPVGDDLWVPFGMQSALQPYWGENRPFIEIDTAALTLPVLPPAFSIEPGSVFYEAAYQVYETGNNLDASQINIALFWADGGGTATPGGHSISMLKEVLEQQESSLEDAALAYAKLGIAISDAFLACWKAKFIHNLCRPVTYIRQHIDSTWLPLIATPPFPEYPSGHSSQSGAMATVLSQVFGEPFFFVDSTHGTNFGGPRAFNSFFEAGSEAAISRLYGGIHYEFGNMAGFTLGQTIGSHVNDLFSQLNVATKDPHSRTDDIAIYPNPASDRILVSSSPHLQGSAWQLLDLHGKTVLSGEFRNENMSVDVYHLTPGLYVFFAGDASIPKMLVKH